MKEIWIAGYPSFYGGADTELLHNIDLWLAHDVQVNLVPMWGEDAKIREHMDRMGVITHKFTPDIFKDKIVASWCNGPFLEELPRIIEQGRPRTLVWANCMTWTFPNEVRAHKEGWINYHAFVSNYQKTWLKPELEKTAPVNELEGYRPYFNPANISQQIEFQYREPKDFFAVGRISRDDQHKYSTDMWNIFYKVCSPVPKKVFILGYGANTLQRVGQPPGAFNDRLNDYRQIANNLLQNRQLMKVGWMMRDMMRCYGTWTENIDWQGFQPGEVPVRQVYNLLHAIIHKTGGSRESYCRIVPEAYSYGVPMIVENDFAFPDIVQDGVTGFLCKSSDEMAFRASQLAFDEPRRKKMIHDAYDFLVNDIASLERCWKPWQRLFDQYGDK